MALRKLAGGDAVDDLFELPGIFVYFFWFYDDYELKTPFSSSSSYCPVYMPLYAFVISLLRL